MVGGARVTIAEVGELIESPELLDALTPEEQVLYLQLLEQRLSEWSLDHTPRGALANALASKVDWLLCGGSASGGKSETLAFHAREQAIAVPGSHGLILRTTKPELRRSFVLRTIARFAQTGDNKRAKLREMDNVLAWWWDNGSIIEFGFCLRDADVGQFLSAEYDYVCFDESTQFTPYQITMICGRLRTTHEKAKKGARPHAVFATNPGSASHEWHRELFVETTEYGRYIVILDISKGFTDDQGMIDWDKCRVHRRMVCPKTVADVAKLKIDSDNEKHLVIAFVPFGVTDNPFVDPSVMRGLNALPEMERRQKRDGDWDAFTGRYFTEFGNVHIVDPFETPLSWDYGIGLDHGYSAPFAAVFGAWDGDGNCWVFDEVYDVKLTPAQQAERVLAKLRVTRQEAPAKIRARMPVGDPSAFHSKGEGRSIADQWADAGMRAIQASNARIDGWANVREYLRVPEDGKPHLFIFSSCSNLIRELRNARQDPGRPEDVDTHGSDHALDALRYLLAIRPRRGARLRQTVKAGGSRVEQLVSKELDRIRKAGRRKERRLGLA